jgi:large subunit ribosomal protein L14e
MGFSKFVEIGRVACIKRGVNEGKLVVILDVLNLNRVLVEGADSQNAVQRTVLPIKSLALTAQKINILRSVKTSLLKKAI